MLKNNNNAIIKTLAKKSLRNNRKKYGILFFTIILSSFLIFSIFTIGITYLDLSRLQNIRFNGADYDSVVINGFDSKQKEYLDNNENVQSVGIQTYSGYIKSSNFDDTVDVGLLWCDDVFWQKQSAPARTMLKGHYPQKENELMVTREGLKKCGNEILDVGDSLTLTYEVNTGIYEKEFVISGIWDGFGDKSIFYVSKDFYNNSGYSLYYDGILHIKYQQNYFTNKVIQEVETGLDLNDRQVFQTTSLAENSFKILLGTLGLGLIVGLSAYLLIYNILYLSIYEKVRYYGLLQTLGMTKKQLIRLMKYQIALLALLAIIIGILSGIGVSIIILPKIMETLGIVKGNIEINFYSLVMIISILFSVLSIGFGMKKPLKLLGTISPIEAVKYQDNLNINNKSHQIKKKNFFWHMAIYQLKNNKKRTVIILFSLATSLSVFYCLTTIINSQAKRTVLPNYLDSDFVIYNQSETTEDINSIKPIIDNNLVKQIKKIDGVKEVHVLSSLPIVIPYEANGFSEQWFKGYVTSQPYLSYPDLVSQYQANPAMYYGMLKGIDEVEFDHLNQLLATPVDKEDFNKGKFCIIQYSQFEIPESCLDSKVSFLAPDGTTKQIPIKAVSYESYYGGSRNIGANIIVSQNYLEQISADYYIKSLTIKYDESYDETVEKQILACIEDKQDTNDIAYESKLEAMKEIQASQEEMMVIGIVISLLLLLVGSLNYANTMASCIQSRQLSYSIMESIGMTRKQIRNLLIKEGILYGIGSIVITATVGTIITYIAFQMLNYMGAPFTIPVLPLIIAIVIIMIICIIVPLYWYHKLSGNLSIIERLRN